MPLAFFFRFLVFGLVPECFDGPIDCPVRSPYGCSSKPAPFPVFTQVRKKRRGLFLKVAVLLLSVALAIGGIFGYQTYQAYLESERQRKIAISRQQEAEEQL